MEVKKKLWKQLEENASMKEKTRKTKGGDTTQ